MTKFLTYNAIIFTIQSKNSFLKSSNTKLKYLNKLILYMAINYGFSRIDEIC